MFEGIDIILNMIEKISLQSSNQNREIEVIEDKVNTATVNSEKIPSSIQNISSSVEAQVAAVEKVGATSSHLASMTEKLNDMIKYFKA